MCNRLIKQWYSRKCHVVYWLLLRIHLLKYYSSWGANFQISNKWWWVIKRSLLSRAPFLERFVFLACISPKFTTFCFELDPRCLESHKYILDGLYLVFSFPWLQYLSAYIISGCIIILLNTTPLAFFLSWQGLSCLSLLSDAHHLLL